MISDRRLEHGEIRGRLLLREDTPVLTENNRQALRRYAERGGRVLLTGKGEALCLPQPPFRASANIDPQLPPENVLQPVLPCADRRVSLDGPETVEVTLRQKGSDWILHLVNIASGQRERDPKALGFLNLHVKKLPPAPACRVSTRLADSQSVSDRPGMREKSRVL